VGSDNKGGTKIEGVFEKGAKDNIWTKRGYKCMSLEKIV
jgi:hypothetical protein